MSKRDYPRLPIEDFGRHLIVSGDLDPVYIALGDGLSSVEQLQRWLVAYWCFYHCGLACHMSEMEGPGFWKEMMRAARNETPAPTGGRWPRGHERRHARGEQGLRMVAGLRERYLARPQEMVESLLRHCQGGVTYESVAQRVQEHTYFGPWIAFKVADMLERICAAPINFSEAAVFMFKDPVKAAEMLYRQRAGVPENARVKTEAVVHPIVEHLREAFKDLSAPPHRERGIELQEVETVLCKWKSHMNGHYPLNNDINEIRAGLAGWGETARAFDHALPQPMEELR